MITDIYAWIASSCNIWFNLVIANKAWSALFALLHTGLCSKDARVPQATNFCLWATR